MSGELVPVFATTLAASTRDLGGAEQQFDQLLFLLDSRRALSDYEMWARAAVIQRRALLPHIAGILESLPPLTAQVLHGDFASPNLLFDGDHLSAIVDFTPPKPFLAAYDISRIGCDPETVINNPHWLDGLTQLLRGCRHAHPGILPADLTACVRVWVIAAGRSTYPVGSLLRGTALLPELLLRYGIARHQAVLTILDRIDEIDTTLHDALTC